MIRHQRVYKGYRGADGSATAYAMEGDAIVPLKPRFDLVRHSPTGFEWGYGGSGPAQLALAICCDVLGDDQAALAVYQRFKASVIQHLDRDTPWVLRAAQVRNVLERIERERRANA